MTIKAKKVDLKGTSSEPNRHTNHTIQRILINHTTHPAKLCGASLSTIQRILLNHTTHSYQPYDTSLSAIQHILLSRFQNTLTPTLSSFYRDHFESISGCYWVVIG